MNVVEALKTKTFEIKVEYENKSLYWDKRGFWRVRKQVGDSKYDTVIIKETTKEEIAIDALLNF